MKIMWVRQNKMDRKKKAGDATKAPAADAAAAMKRTGSVSGENAKEQEEAFVFQVVPDQVSLGPKMGIMVEVRAYSHHIGQLSEAWECQVLIG